MTDAYAGSDSSGQAVDECKEPDGVPSDIKTSSDTSASDGECDDTEQHTSLKTNLANGTYVPPRSEWIELRRETDYIRDDIEDDDDFIRPRFNYEAIDALGSDDLVNSDSSVEFVAYALGERRQPPLALEHALTERPRPTNTVEQPIEVPDDSEDDFEITDWRHGQSDDVHDTDEY